MAIADNFSPDNVEDGQTKAAILAILKRRGRDVGELAKAAAFYDICSADTVNAWLLQDDGPEIGLTKAERIVTLLRCHMEIIDDFDTIDKTP